LLPGPGAPRRDPRSPEGQLVTIARLNQVEVGKVPVTDPIADMLTRIRNGSQARHSQVTLPFSKVKSSVAQILKDEGFVRDFSVVRAGAHRGLRINLIYGPKGKPAITGIQRVSKPALRVYAGASEIPRVYGGLGVAVLSTSKGVMTGSKAYKEKVGGEIICVVW